MESSLTVMEKVKDGKIWWLYEVILALTYFRRKGKRVREAFGLLEHTSAYWVSGSDYYSGQSWGHKADDHSLSCFGYSRNIGLEYCDGSVVILSDDDCWYHRDSLKIINDEFTKDPNLDVLFTQIYDQENKALYKSNYARIVKNIKQKKELLSKSSIEIAFKKDSCTTRFDEVFGLGGVYNSGEEVDFLLNNFSKERTFKYIPRVTVYHPRKKGISDSGRVINRGALYAKNFSIVRSFIDVTKDLLFRKQNNFRLFFTGYFRYKYHF